MPAESEESQEPPQQPGARIPNLGNFEMVVQDRDSAIIKDIMSQEFSMARWFESLALDQLEQFQELMAKHHRHVLSDSTILKYGVLLKEMGEVADQRQRLEDAKHHQLSKFKHELKQMGSAELKKAVEASITTKRREEQEKAITAAVAAAAKRREEQDKAITAAVAAAAAEASTAASASAPQATSRIWPFGRP